MTQVYLNGVGIVCALGKSANEVYKGIFSGTSPLVQTNVYDQPTYVGKVSEPLPLLTDYQAVYRTRNNQLAALAFAQIADLYTQLRVDSPTKRVAVVIGTSTSGVASGEASMSQYLQDGQHCRSYAYAMQEMGAPATFVAELAGAKGCTYGISTACTSSAKAIISGQRLLAANLADIVIAGGVDSLCNLTIRGFYALESIANERCKPFQNDRNGINVGEGAALFVMSKQPSEIALAGFGESSDAYHISAPHPQGKGAIMAMQAALESANIAAKQVDYINLHGTGTVQNDAMEAIAVNQVFGSSARCSSTKSLHGHCLGAAGAIEAALCWLLLSNRNYSGICPGNGGDGKLDGQLAQMGLITNTFQAENPLQYCMSNSYAFGGNNCSLILARHHVSN